MKKIGYLDPESEKKSAIQTPASEKKTFYKQSKS